MDLLFASYLFFGLIGTLTVAAVGGFMGVFLVLRRYSLLADAISHIALLGAATTIAIGFYNIWLAIFIVVSISLSIEYLRKNGKFQSDSVIALFITSSLALSISIFSLTQKSSIGLESYLFGSLATIDKNDFYAILAISAICVTTFTIFFKYFKIITFDEEFAKVCGVKTELLSYILIALIAAFIVVSIKAVGVLMVSSLLVMPTLIALNFRLSFGKTAFFASLISLLSATLGILLSILLPIPLGASIVISLLALFLLSFATIAHK